jgi:hypothetical protein
LWSFWSLPGVDAWWTVRAGAGAAHGLEIMVRACVSYVTCRLCLQPVLAVLSIQLNALPPLINRAIAEELLREPGMHFTTQLRKQRWKQL